MDKKSRVLAYTTAKELTNEDLLLISGGASSGTYKTTHKMTGNALEIKDIAMDFIPD